MIVERRELGNYKWVDAKCSMCGVTIRVEVHEDYDAIWDSMKLIPMATCNRCYDFRDARKRVGEALAKLCSMLHFAPPEKKCAVHAIVRPIVEKCLKAYCLAVAKYNGLQGMAYDEEMLNVVMDKPDKWLNVIHLYTKNFKRDYRPTAPDP